MLILLKYQCFFSHGYKGTCFLLLQGLSQHLRGMRRRSLFNEKAGASNKSVDKASDRHSVNSTTPKCKTIHGDINSKPLRTPPCALPGIGLHLNAFAAIPKEKIVCQDIQSSINESSNLPCPAGSSPPPFEQNIIKDEFAQRTDVASAEPSSQGSPKKKRYHVYAPHFKSTALFCWKIHEMQ